MQMPAAGVDEAAEVTLAHDVRAQLIAIEHAHGPIAVTPEFARPLLEFQHVARLHRHVQMIRLVVAGNRELPNERLRKIETLDREVEQASRIRGAHLGLEFLLTHGETEDRLAAVATGRAIAHLTGLEQGHPKPAAGEVQRGGAARNAPAHDGDIGGELPAQRCPGALPSRVARGLERVGVIGDGRRFG
jgi:hypothetical protein